MIRNASDMFAALRKGLFTGLVLYRGASTIDGAPIVAIANRINNKSKNAKTGALVQTFILRQDVAPLEAIKSGEDESICGDCPARKANNGHCYVNVAQSVTSVYKAFLRGRYAEPGLDYDPAIIPALFAGLAVRLGTYGDPAAVPFQVWRAMTLKAAFVNGYTHQWKDKRFAAFKLLCMASCDDVADYLEAQANGWRTFRVRNQDEDKAKGEVICPASEEAGHKTSCEACKACGGHSAKAKASIVIMAHGVMKAKFAQLQTIGLVGAA